jgi:hypothetical protein
MAKSKQWALKYDDSYFREMTHMGPRCTTDVKLAAKFSTKKEAMQSDAYSFTLTCFVPVMLPANDTL